MDTLTTFEAALKEYYNPHKINSLLYRKRPLYQMVKKNTGFYGKNYHITPIKFGVGGAGAYDFARAQKNSKANSASINEFKVDAVKCYYLNHVDGILLDAAQGSKAAFIDATKQFFEDPIYLAERDLGISLYRTGYGDRGQIKSGSSVSGTTLTLARKSDVYNFEVGDRLQFAANRGDAPKAYGSAGEPVIVVGVNRSAGTITLNANANDATDGVPTVAAGDWIFIDGDAKDSTRTKPTGLEGWLVYGTLTDSDDFFGVDRSTDQEKLAGVQVDGSSQDIMETLHEAASKVASVGGNIDYFFCSYSTWNDAVHSLQGKVVIEDHRNGDFGFKAISITTPNGEAKLVPDLHCPTDRVFGLQMDTWELVSIGDPVKKLTTDGLAFLRAADGDNYEIRYRFSGVLTCFAPGYNAIINLGD